MLADSSAVIEQLLAPLFAVLDPSKRYFWPFLLSSFLLIPLALWQQGKPVTSLWADKKAIKNYCFNRSHLEDIGLIFFNNALRLLFISPLLLSHIAASLLVAKGLYELFGSGPAWQLPSFWLMSLFTLCFFLLDDISRFALHMALHKLPWLWHLHKVHHSAKVLSPLTVSRMHPLEMLLYMLRQLLVVALVSGVFVWLFKGQISGWHILGVEFFGFVFNLLGSNLRHSHFALHFGVLEKVLISPKQHQIHHSTLPEHRDKNFGSFLSLWDKWAGSLVYSKAVSKPLRFGIH
jgi:sterol desaturase/sphingolipid hydroxylase (fatty acid hydroxylase superfamily)